MIWESRITILIVSRVRPNLLQIQINIEVDNIANLPSLLHNKDSEELTQKKEQARQERNRKHEQIMANPIVKAVHRTQNNFLAATFDFAAFSATKGGTYVTALGVATTPMGIGAPIMALGSTMSALGNGYYGLQNIMEGHTTTGLYRIGTSLFFYYLPFSLNKYMTEGQQAIFNGYLLPHSIIIDKTTE